VYGLRFLTYRSFAMTVSTQNLWFFGRKF